ncbi:glycosyltransferase family protein [Desulfobaculum bizertense]|uniref:Predicted glycosyl transferase n=1 Tax=Desulfobaculum bizertense DSM 18034 TaxID=1121442 RepID=A0A1T4WPH4_9BACT|nr:glycosyltransferase [Desulfobaculum bizertense]SKA79149.1 Predicted glycosyl transferase [Desulfobaculum bizertense DSM 18034]
MRILFYSQHVLGVGHVARSLEIARACIDAGHTVTLVTGGEELPLPLPEGILHEKLPALRMDSTFSHVLPAHYDMPKTPLSEKEQARLDELLAEIMEQRVDRLMKIAGRFRPHIFLTELFPFGRRAFRFELIPVLTALQSGAFGPCKIVCSLRDILVEKADQQKYEERVLKILNRSYSGVLIHSDPNVFSLDETFSRTADIRPPVHYTGYVAPRPRPEKSSSLRKILKKDEKPLIVASAGGGSEGYPLLSTTLEASIVLSASLPHTLRILSGPYLDEQDFALLQAKASTAPHIHVERFSTEFPELLAAADLSLSMGGYNTLMNLLAAQTYGLVLPFTQNREQRMRAERLAARGVLEILQPKDLEPDRLSQIMHTTLQATQAGGTDLDLSGARSTANLLQQFMESS